MDLNSEAVGKMAKVVEVTAGAVQVLAETGCQHQMHVVSGFENNPAIHGWVGVSQKWKSRVRDGRISLSSLTDWFGLLDALPGHEWLGHFQIKSFCAALLSAFAFLKFKSGAWSGCSARCVWFNKPSIVSSCTRGNLRPAPSG